MPVKTFRPLTPGRRFLTVSDFSNITKKKPEKKLVKTKKKQVDVTVTVESLPAPLVGDTNKKFEPLIFAETNTVLKLK
jgi:hypothetical protein